MRGKPPEKKSPDPHGDQAQGEGWSLPPPGIVQGGCQLDHPAVAGTEMKAVWVPQVSVAWPRPGNVTSCSQAGNKVPLGSENEHLVPNPLDQRCAKPDVVPGL